MLTRHFHSRLLLSYVLSNTLVFLLPVAVLGWLMYQSAVVNLRGEIESATMRQLTQAKEATERNMVELSRIAAKIAYDPALTPYMVRHDRYASIGAIDALARYRALNGVTEDVHLYFRGGADIYSGLGVSDFDVFAKTYYRFDATEAKQFANLMDTVETPYVYPARTVVFNYMPTRMLTLLFPIKEQTPYGTVLFWLRESKLADLIESAADSYERKSMIVQDDGTVIADSRAGQDDPLSAQMVELLRENGEDGIAQVRWSGQKYAVAVVHSDKMGWKFATAMPTDQFFGRVIEKRTFLLLVLGLVLTAGLLAALLTSLRLYRPIRKLTRHVRERFGGDADASRDELEMIRHTLDATLDMRQDLEARIELQRPWVEQMTLIKLLAGDWTASEPDLLGRLAPDMAGRRLAFAFVLLLQSGEDALYTAGRDGSAALGKERLLLRLASFPVPGGLGLGAELIQERTIALIVLIYELADGETPKSAQRRTALVVQELLEMAGSGAAAALAIGGPVSELQQVNRSFVEASAALEYARKLNVGGALFFDEMSDRQDGSSWFSAEEQLKLVHGLKMGDEAVALESLGAMVQRLAEQPQSLLLLRCMSFDIVNTLLKTMNEMQVREDAFDLRELAEFSSLASLEERASKLVRTLCRTVSSRKASELALLHREVTDYIHRGFASYELTLDSAADRFGMSQSSMSRLIKEVTGSTFTDYVSDLRMNEIKRQLASTDLPIKDIVVSVGYVDVSAFMRKFKKSEGITLGEYRKLYAK